MNTNRNIGLFVTLFWLASSVAPPPGNAQSAVAAPDKVVLLDQGWSTNDRLQYYYTSQGSAVMPYDLFLNLEQAESQQLFRSNANLESFGLIPQPADPEHNRDGLPIGIARTSIPDGRWQGAWVGVSCAACHVGQLNYRGTKIRVDGGSASQFDFVRLAAALDAALTSTAASPDKFDRLAMRMKREEPALRAQLEKQVSATAAALHHYSSRSAQSASAAGPGRMDALTLIHNQAAANELGIPENWAAPLAPVKPPFLWNAPQSSWVQWSGTLNNPLARNVGESVGTFMKMDLTSTTPQEGLFDTSVDIRGQIRIEQLLRRLAPPKWPEDVLGRIDRVKAAAGAKLFVENCSECHSTWPHRWSEPKVKGKRFIENAIVPLEVVGTDSTQFHTPQFDARPTSLTGNMSAYLRAPNQGAALVQPSVLLADIVLASTGKALARLGLTQDELEDAFGYRASEPIPPQPAYKAAPREGSWSTAPFLHNGSVPNLYELLLPARQRSKQFFVGREFDPVKVGVDTSGNSGKFLLDTTLLGNSNRGHSFEDGQGPGIIGRQFSEEERWALIEYLKSIPSQSAQVTPYGGPVNPIKAWEDPVFFHTNHKHGYDGK